MSDNEELQQTSKKGGGAGLVWAATILIAFAIIGFCAFIAVNNAKPKVQSVPINTPVLSEEMPIIEEMTPEPESQENQYEEVEIYTPQDMEIPLVEEEAEPKVEPVVVPEDVGPPELQLDNLAGTLELHLPFMDIRSKMPLDHTCYRKNESPAMDWEGVPSGTQSFVVFLEKREIDKDPYVSWILFNVPGEESRLAGGQSKEGTLASGAKHANADHNNIGYTGPCEAKGRHNYAIRIFALDTVLDLQPGAHKHDLIRAMNGHIIDAAEQEFHHYYRL